MTHRYRIWYSVHPGRGFLNHHKKICTCAPVIVTKHQKEISDLMLDRIGIHIELLRVEYEKLSGDRMGESLGLTVRGFKQTAISSKHVSEEQSQGTLQSIICNTDCIEEATLYFPSNIYYCNWHQGTRFSELGKW